MTLEIRKPELVQRAKAQIQSGHFLDTDELIEKALDALDVTAAAASPAATGTVVFSALQASPYREVDRTPPRVCLTVTSLRGSVICLRRA